MNHLKSIFAIFLIATFSFTSCAKDEATVTSNLTAKWTSTAIKISGVASPASTTMSLNLLASKQYEITTNIAPFSQAKTGVWSNTSSKLTLGTNAWTIHHVSGKELKIEFTLDGKDLEINLSK